MRAGKWSNNIHRPISANKTFSKKVEFFLCNKRKIAVKPTIHRNSAVSKLYLENVKITDHKYRFWILKITEFLADIGYLVKLLNNDEASFSTKNFKNITLRAEVWS